MRSPKSRRNQRSRRECGGGTILFSSARGMEGGNVPERSRVRCAVSPGHSSLSARLPSVCCALCTCGWCEESPRMWEIVRAGGPLMWPIILCSIIAAAIILERLWTLQDKRVLPQELPQRVWQLIEANQVNDKVIAALEQNSPLGKLLAAGLANRHRPREILMERLEDTGRHVVYELERFLNTLGTIAGVSPLLGLLGTVTGIIRAFSVIQAGGMGDPRALSGGIAEALIATAAGLCVAIPALISYRYLRGRVDRIVIEMEKSAIRIADAVEAAGRRERASGPASAAEVLEPGGGRRAA